MSRLSEAYGGIYLKPADILRPTLLTTEAVRFDSLTDFKDRNKTNDRLVLSFIECGKDLVVNKFSVDTLIAAWGDDERAYIGKQVVLYTTETNIAGAMRKIIMVRLPRQAAASAPAPAAPPPIDPNSGDFDDDIPF